MLNTKQLSILENIFEATFGKGSMNDLGHALRHKIMTDQSDGELILELRLERGINFAPNEGLAKQKSDLDGESFKALANKIKDAKKEFRELSETSLKVKQLGKEQSDILPYSFNRDLVRARYVARINYKIGV
tara:strand:- start:6763 stop:7158 length:396 start_codon:yes stop_codon:yes gene_type:complete